MAPVLQVALTVTPQDVAAGLDSYVITSSDGVTFYGGIQRWASADGTLTFELDEAAADTLGLDPTVTIALPADASVQDITAGLHRVVAVET